MHETLSLAKNDEACLKAESLRTTFIEILSFEKHGECNPLMHFILEHLCFSAHQLSGLRRKAGRIRNFVSRLKKDVNR